MRFNPKVGIAIGFGGVSSSPLSLFAASEPGFWFDPSDLSTLFQDAAGTTPVTAAGQSVGLVLDKSKGLALGPELVTNGGFDTDTAWTKTATAPATVAITGGKLTIVSPAGEIAHAGQTLVTPGKLYQVTGSVTIRSGSVKFVVGGGSTEFIFTTSQSFSFLARAVSNNFFDISRVAPGGCDADFDNISVRELPGYHATQSTSLSRPTLGRNPVGGGRNLLTYTEQFDNAAWTMSVNATANQTIAPNGTLTADKWTLASSGQSTVQSNPVSGTAVTFSTYIKKGDTNVFSLLIRNATTSTSICRYMYTYSNTTATLMSGNGSATIIDVGNDWVRASISVSSGISPGEIVQGYIYPCDTSGVAGNYAYLWGAQLETGSTATAYQKVVSSFDVTEAGKDDCWYLGFDGSDDFLVTPTITPGTDKVQVFAGVRKLSDAARGTVVELTASAAANNGAIHLAAPNAASATIAFESKGTALTDAVGASTAPDTLVASGLGDIAGDSNILRINGVQADSDTADQGTGNYTAAPLYIGRRGGTSLPFNGRIYSLIYRFGSNLTADQIAQTEAWVNSKTGAY